MPNQVPTSRSIKSSVAEVTTTVLKQPWTIAPPYHWFAEAVKLSLQIVGRAIHQTRTLEMAHILQTSGSEMTQRVPARLPSEMDGGATCLWVCWAGVGWRSHLLPCAKMIRVIHGHAHSKRPNEIVKRRGTQHAKLVKQCGKQDAILHEKPVW